MAERLDHYDWSANRRRTNYPWDEWCDGSIWRVKQGEDFEVSARSLESTLRAKAKVINKTAKVRIEQGPKTALGSDEPQGIVVFQFVEPDRPRVPLTRPTEAIGVRRGPGRPRKS